VKNFVLAVLAVAVIVLATLYVRQRYSAEESRNGNANNLKYVKCKAQLGLSGAVTIPINSTNYGIARNDQIVFVCDGEMVHWDSTADPNVTSFTISFKGGVWPFGKAPQNPPTVLTSSAGLTKDEKVVGPVNKYAQDYEYTLDVQRTNGTAVHVDPHVIPMGP
jgi:hypothetical protein